MDLFLEADKFMNPKDWTKKWRRRFVATIPVSGPLWLVCAFALFVIMALIAIILTMAMPLIELWEEDD